LSADGGLEQQRHPALPEEPVIRPVEDPQADLLGFLEDEVDEVAGTRAVERVRSLAPAVAAHALNEGSAPSDELVPSF
jgi:type IV secretion system protein VirD4